MGQKWLKNGSKWAKVIVSFICFESTGCFKFFCILKQYPYLGNGCFKNERLLLFYVQNIRYFHCIMLIFQLSH